MSVTATITKHFHRDQGVMRRGDVVSETMRFIDFADMNRFGEQINANHRNVPYAITSATVNSQNFVCFDLAEIDAAYGVLEWNEIK